jgi:hypothetical protein
MTRPAAIAPLMSVDDVIQIEPRHSHQPIEPAPARKMPAGVCCTTPAKGN